MANKQNAKAGFAGAHGSAFQQGYVCAVAEIIRTHGADMVAKDVLRAAGNIDWRCIDEYDKETLLKAGLYSPNAPGEPRRETKL